MQKTKVHSFCYICLTKIVIESIIYIIYEVVVGKSKFKAKQFKKFNYSSTEVSANEQVYLAQIEKVYPVFVCAFLMLDWNHRFSLRKTI